MVALPNTETVSLMPHESKLAQAEASRYIEQQKSANLYTKIADYMFWGATSLILPLAGIALSIVEAPAVLGVAATLALGSAISASTFLGSLFFARKATDISERSNILYSDIDSQNQARRMVQTFARAQSTDISADKDAPYTAEGNISAKDSGQEHASATPQTHIPQRWQDKIAAQADREDAVSLEQMSL